MIINEQQLSCKFSFMLCIRRRYRNVYRDRILYCLILTGVYRVSVFFYVNLIMKDCLRLLQIFFQHFSRLPLELSFLKYISIMWHRYYY